MFIVMIYNAKSTYPSHGMSRHPYIGLCYPQLIYLHISDVFNYENM